MKRHLLFVLFFLGLSNALFAGPSRMFQYDLHKVELSLLGVNRIDKVVSLNHWDALDFQRNLILSQMASKKQSEGKNKKLLGIPGFFWGCLMPFPVMGITVLSLENSRFATTFDYILLVYYGALIVGGLLAVYLVYQTTKSKKQALLAFLGCLTTNVVVPIVAIYAIAQALSGMTITIN